MSRVRRPNILLVMTDQHRFDHVGFNGNAVVQTPTLDALAETGRVYRQTYVASPTCAPNRASLLTGRSSSAHGLRVNGLPLAPGTPTIADALLDAGYVTHHIGKSHLQPYGITAERDGGNGDGELDPETQWENRQRHERELVSMPEPYYGFQHVEVTCGHGDNVGGHYVHWLRERGIDPDQVRGELHATEKSSIWGQVYRPALPAELYPTTYITERAESAIRRYSEDDAPFFLVVSFPDPHHPFTPPGKYWSMYDPDDMPLPPSFDAAHVREPEHVRRLREHRGEGGDEYTGWAPTVEQFRQALAAQYGMITMIDDSISRLIGVLKDAGQLDTTVIIFTSDHGDMFGDHGLMFKHALHYQGCIRVPLLIAGPGIAAAQVEDLVSTVDIGATILDLAGVDQLPGSVGEPLKPTSPDERAPRTSVLIEEDEEFSLPGLPGPIRIRTVVTGEGRLTLYNNGMGELYATRDDPDELVNLFGRPEAAQLEARLREQLLLNMIEADDRSRKPTVAG